VYRLLNLFDFNLEPRPVFPLPHRPAPAIPGKKPMDSNKNQQTTENIYLSAMDIPPQLIKEEDNLSKTPTKKSDEVPFEDKVTIKIKFDN
jgi:hypothetical protein